MQTYPSMCWRARLALVCGLGLPSLTLAAAAPPDTSIAARAGTQDAPHETTLAWRLLPRRHKHAVQTNETDAQPARAKASRGTVLSSLTPPTDAADAVVVAPATGAAAEAVESVETTDVVAVAANGEIIGSDTSTWYGEAWPQFDRVIDAYTGRTSRKHTFNTLITHRNRAGFARAPFDTLFGFDGGSLKVGLGLRFGILDELDVGIFRMNGTKEVFDTYDFDLRYQFFKQARFGVDMAVRAGVTWFPVPASIKALKKAPYDADSSGFFASLLINRVFANRVLAGASVLYHANSSGPDKNVEDSHGSVAVQLYTDVRVTEGVSLALEYTQPFAGYHQFNPDVSFGPRFITNRHTFAIVMSNTQWFDAAGMVTGNARTSIRDWVLGFNITREL